MGETCQIEVERVRNLIVCQRWRFVAVHEGAVIAASPAFWSSAGVIARTDREETALGWLLHDLARRGWQPPGRGDAPTGGRQWYRVRLCRA